MYISLWNKYLPIIRILFKKSINGVQTLNLNISDFERAGVAKKSGNKFLVKFVNGRVDNVIIDSPLASNFATTLLQDPVIKDLLTKNEYHLMLNTKFVLTITCIPAITEEVAEEIAELATAE
jgi:hypothetical protein